MKYPCLATDHRKALSRSTCGRPAPMIGCPEPGPGIPRPGRRGRGAGAGQAAGRGAVGVAAAGGARGAASGGAERRSAGEEERCVKRGGDEARARRGHKSTNRTVTVFRVGYPGRNSNQIQTPNDSLSDGCWIRSAGGLKHGWLATQRRGWGVSGRGRPTQPARPIRGRWEFRDTRVGLGALPQRQERVYRSPGVPPCASSDRRYRLFSRFCRNAPSSELRAQRDHRLDS